MIIKRRNSNIYEQREFGFFTSKIKRPIQRSIGRQKRKLANRLEESGKSYLEKSNKFIKPGYGNSELDKKLKLQLSEYKGELVEAPFKPSDTNISQDALTHMNLHKGTRRADTVNILESKLSNPNISNVNRKYLENQLTAVKNTNNRHVVALGQEDLSDNLAHELGHIENRYGTKNPFRKIISSIDDKTRARSQKVYVNGKTDSVLKDLIADIVTVQEEKNASKSAIKNLKTLGVTKENLKESKRMMDESLDTYKNIAKARRRYNLRNLIRPKKKNE